MCTNIDKPTSEPRALCVNYALGSEVPRLVLGDWGCYTDRMTGKNVDVANGDLRRGNRAYMPPEILSAARGKVLDYRRCDINHIHYCTCIGLCIDEPP